MKVELKYKDEDFNDETLSVEISFISQRMVKSYGELVGSISQIQYLHSLIESADEYRAEIITSDLSLSEKKEKEKEFQEKLDTAKEEYVALCHSGIDKKRMELIELILKANKIENEKLYDPEFWENCVDPAEINEFVSSCVTRDKKKVK